MTKKNKNKNFRTEKGVAITQSLFLEIGYKLNLAMFTLEDEDKVFKDVEYPSLKKRFLEMEDPTEYMFATTYLGGWNHWKRLCANGMLKPHIEEWREELQLKLKAQGVKSMIKEAQMGGKGQATAARWLAANGWLDDGDSKKQVGRPKAKVDPVKEAKGERIIKDALAEDLERLAKNSNIQIGK